MPAYNPSILISDCYGSAGSITFYHRDGKCRWRRRSSLSFAGTPAQCAALSVHRRALAAWRTISDTEKERWHDIAKNVQPRRPPFGSGGHISGHNLFVSAYHGFVPLGDEHIPQPVEYHPFPVSMVEIVSASVTNSSGLRILLRLSMPQEREPERYALLCKVQLTEAGKGCNPGKMRNILAEETETRQMRMSVRHLRWPAMPAIRIIPSTPGLYSLPFRTTVYSPASVPTDILSTSAICSSTDTPATGASIKSYPQQSILHKQLRQILYRNQFYNNILTNYNYL